MYQKSENHVKCNEMIEMKRNEISLKFRSFFNLHFLCLFFHIFKCRSTVFNQENPDHEKLLRRLWSVVKPEEYLHGLIDPQWKNIGFQGNSPATDFRTIKTGTNVEGGMGLLGLLNLIYFAEH